jgi:hypothetical protein
MLRINVHWQLISVDLDTSQFEVPFQINSVHIQGGGVELLGMSIGSAQYTRCCGRNAIHNRQLYDRI